MEGLTPVQISELVTLLDDAILTRDDWLNGEKGDVRAALENEIDHLEAELAWIQWMRENYPGHEENGFPGLAVEEHIQGMRAGIKRWRAKLRREGADENYIQSLKNSIQIVGQILAIFERVRGVE